MWYAKGIRYYSQKNLWGVVVFMLYGEGGLGGRDSNCLEGSRIENRSEG